MELPVELKHTMHRNGGRITRITSIGHSIDKPRGGRSWDRWFYIGDVQWDDGGKSQSTEIAPYCLAFDDDRSEIDALSDLMMAYLGQHGEWCDSATKHEGWYAHRKNRRAA